MPARGSNRVQSAVAGPQNRTGSEDKLARYREKRDFGRTPEPDGAASRAGKPAEAEGIFVVQHHWARREHYDFRLELDGVLVSFAVAKGPSLDPKQRRLAVKTEDHPLSYASFEGTIPKGEYGGGTVMLWDRGVWMPRNGDPRAGLEKGELKFVVLGERMKGGWVLVRMNTERGRENWLLIKERDDYVDRDAGDYPARHVTSIATGRTREEIEREEIPHSFAADRVAEAAAEPADSAPPAPAQKAAKSKSRSKSADTAKGEPSPTKAGAEPPAFVRPTLCSVREAAPEGVGWLHEMKYDGYRLQAAVDQGTVHLYTREGLDWTKRFPSIRGALAGLSLDRALIDGEAVVFDAQGLTDFPALVDALDGPGKAISYVMFDLLAIAGEDLTDKPLIERKARLAALMSGRDEQALRLAGHVIGDGPAVFQSAVEGGAEGIVSKRVDSPYRSGRGQAWVKVKGDRREDVIVVGYLPSDKRAFRSLHCAVETGERLRYVGGVGTGFSEAELERTGRRLAAARLDGPRSDLDGAEAAPKGIVWVEPRERMEVRLTGWTGGGIMRHPRFLGWREDRPSRPTGRPKGAVAPDSRTRSPRPDDPARPAISRPSAADRRTLLTRITTPERLVYPQAGISKQAVADYYLAVADRLMPHVEGRPLSFVRAPEGFDGESFFQRHPLPGMKRGIVPVRDPEGRHKDYLGIESLDGLVTAAQFGVLEVHGWMARLPDLRAPDRMVFDFDPDEGLGFGDVKDAALALKEVLDSVGLVSFVMASGGKGLHVVVPLDASQTFDDLGDFSGGIARGLSKADPSRFVSVASKARRTGRIFIDWLRNRPYATAILPWSPRLRPGASVAMPLAWGEVKRLRSADRFTIKTAARRSDPWVDFWRIRQQIDPDALAWLKRSLKR